MGSLWRALSLLTPKGDATRLVYRLVAVLGILPEDDRRAVRDLFLAELDGE
jgi:hypothetical protein